MKKVITYKGKTMTTSEQSEMSDEQFASLREEFYAKPAWSSVVEEIGGLINHVSFKNGNITNYYFKDLMAQTKVLQNKWTMADFFEHKPLLDMFYSRTLKNKKVFTSDNVLTNIETAFRLARYKVSNYPIRSIADVLERYNVNNKWYDMSCGWGARLTGALAYGVDYYGTDPNVLLVPRLNQLVEDWERETWTTNMVDIRCQGSEEFVPEWENLMGLCFTSPPYFDLEDYQFGNQSYKPGMSYQHWLDSFLEPTIQNCYRYLIDEGYLALNVKDFEKHNLERDTQEIAERNGFVLVEVITLENIARIKTTSELGNSDENIMVFMKKGMEHTHVPLFRPQQLNLFEVIND